ncbi:MAG: hypothetical protein HKL90_00205 [Elusimicrobia bacterium]|nr:hypothetical protein [Elusimicrobiota bacterium]
MKTTMLVLTFALAATAAMSQTVMNTAAPLAPAKTHAHVHAQAKKAALAPSAAEQIKVLRAEIKKERADFAAKGQALKAERRQTTAQEKAELAQLKKAPGKKADKKQARLALRAKYAALLKDARQKRRSQSAFLREDVKSKRDVISRLRRS